MKKTAAFLITLCLAACVHVNCPAQTVHSSEYGITFTLPDTWVNENSDSGFDFSYNSNKNENVAIEIAKSNWAYSLDFAKESEYIKLCEELHSDSKLAENLSKANNADVSVKADYTNSDYVNYNGVKYFRYEKGYTASAPGYRDSQFYRIVFLTAKNGYIYYISYRRNNSSNHFDDIAALLNTVSYESGEIKIIINGKRIRPDSAPVLINGRTLVPIRAVAEAMNYSVAWDGVNKIVILTASGGKQTVSFQIGAATATKNLTESIALDVPAMIIEDRTYLPVRAVIEAMNVQVNWEDSTRSVLINY